jgi:hypothetical protein
MTGRGGVVSILFARAGVHVCGMVDGGTRGNCDLDHGVRGVSDCGTGPRTFKRGLFQPASSGVDGSGRWGGLGGFGDDLWTA